MIMKKTQKNSTNEMIKLNDKHISESDKKSCAMNVSLTVKHKKCQSNTC